MKKIINLQEGKADGGALFVVTTCLSIICLGLAFVGGNIPEKFPKSNPNGATAGQIISAPAQNTLQLLTFKVMPPKLIPTIDPNAAPLSTDKTPAAPPAGGGTTSGGTAAACGQKSDAPAKAPGLPACSGLTATQPTENGYYEPTNFGCNIGFPKDPGDNCVPACGNIPECAGVSGRACEEKVIWYAANADQYGCNAKLKVTNPTTGKAVIVRAIDRGPGCQVQGSAAKFDISQAAYKEINAGSVVKVEKVADATPLGPVTACQSTTTNQSIATNCTVTDNNFPKIAALIKNVCSQYITGIAQIVSGTAPTAINYSIENTPYGGAYAQGGNIHIDTKFAQQE